MMPDVPTYATFAGVFPVMKRPFKTAGASAECYSQDGGRASRDKPQGPC